MTLSHMYRVHDEVFFGSESFTFTGENAERFESRYREGKFKGHYQPNKPEICLPDHDGIR